MARIKQVPNCGGAGKIRCVHVKYLALLPPGRLTYHIKTANRYLYFMVCVRSY